MAAGAASGARRLSSAIQDLTAFDFERGSYEHRIRGIQIARVETPAPRRFAPPRWDTEGDARPPVSCRDRATVPYCHSQPTFRTFSSLAMRFLIIPPVSPPFPLPALSTPQASSNLTRTALAHGRDAEVAAPSRQEPVGAPPMASWARALA